MHAVGKKPFFASAALRSYMMPTIKLIGESVAAKCVKIYNNGDSDSSTNMQPPTRHQIADVHLLGNISAVATL
jgi:hypothetical protein